MLPDTIRQCSCFEESKCASEMKNQAIGCLEPCWSKFATVSRNPEKLKHCFTNRNFMDSFLNCFEENLKSCSFEPTSRKIQKIDLSSYFRLAISKFKTKNSLLETLTTPIKKILESSRNFAQCVNNCFLQQNSNGFCFDRIGCQPLITEKNAKKSLRKCTKKLNWKQEAGSLCDCAVNVGLIGLENYCPVLKLMARHSFRRFD